MKNSTVLLPWKTPARKATLLRRYKRFFADVELDGNEVTAHVPNTGSLVGLLAPGTPCLVCPADNPERKLQWTLVALQASTGAWVGVDTSRPNVMVDQVVGQRAWPPWLEFATYEREKKWSKETRLDGFFQSSTQQSRYLEIKNVTLRDDENKQALFPDAVTERGQKHLREMITIMSQGYEAELLFFIQRNDCNTFAPAKHLDPDYAQLLVRAQAAGLLITPWQIEVSEQGLVFTGKTVAMNLC